MNPIVWRTSTRANNRNSDSGGVWPDNTRLITHRSVKVGLHQECPPRSLSSCGMLGKYEIDRTFWAVRYTPTRTYGEHFSRTTCHPCPLQRNVTAPQQVFSPSAIVCPS